MKSQGEQQGGMNLIDDGDLVTNATGQEAEQALLSFAANRR